MGFGISLGFESWDFGFSPVWGWGDQRDVPLERLKTVFMNPPLEVRQALDQVKAYANASTSEGHQAFSPANSLAIVFIDK